ncbi:MAG: GGDEF domain-containing protein [Oscillospiraceae bacterium]|nr:GGDEF domain-containing protein [Oscillospiraceae bacterium]
MKINLYLQAASLCFYAIVLMQYLSSRRLPTRSNHIFGALIIVAGINLIFDVLTVYSLAYFDRLPIWLVRFGHQIFIGSMDVLIALLCLYVITIIRGGRALSPGKTLLVFTPLILSMFAVFFGKLYYKFEDGGFYSYGPMASTIYISIALYLLLSIYYLLRYRRAVAAHTRAIILIAIVCESTIALIQLFNPTMLISGLGITMMIVLLYSSLANPEKYTEAETGTINRIGLVTVLRDHLSIGKPFFVLTLCVDSWRDLESAFGQDFALRVMGKIATKLECLTSDRIYHPRGDCLCLICSNDESGTRKLAESILHALEGDLEIGGVGVSVSPRILVTDCPKHFSKAEDFLRSVGLFADGVVKAPEAITIYNDEYAKAVSRRISVEAILKHAVKNDGLTLVYQPIYSTSKRRFTSAEALVRIRDTQTVGFIPPDEFIAIAEQNGLIGELGRIVMEKSCRFVSSEAFKSMGLDYLEVNLSTLQCLNANLSEEFIELMESFGVSPKSLNFEITESAAMEKSEIMLKNLARLGEAGSSFSMDDYGTGYSNLSMMADMPYSIIKIDKSLIWPYFNDSSRLKVLLPSTVHMINSLGFEIVAEGVETQEQLDVLTEMGVEHIQGYFFSKPLPEEDFVKFVSDFSFSA